ncbi:Transforming protein v-Fos/v-Fox [Echinococcus granulosus]|uniref:Transforming protein v-Fos/v-Fox n=1 Tax=Echinococcus granulosus TaxID=6210 RepID=W6U893_ECHGR|nr:Transforming protein v-Fos/v-Fox [Echinococcus granulosus]EUB57385.1 Transforming protein v-Fos/v-Fox [Echinococcus granulosus]
MLVQPQPPSYVALMSVLAFNKSDHHHHHHNHHHHHHYRVALTTRMTDAKVEVSVCRLDDVGPSSEALTEFKRVETHCASLAALLNALSPPSAKAIIHPLQREKHQHLMVVLNCYPAMSSTASTASSNNSNNKSNTVPTSTANGSEFSQEQWLDLLRVLPSSSRMNLQLALRQFLQETGDIETDKIDQKTPLPDASTLVRASLPLDDMPQNTYGTDRYLTLLRQSLELDRKPLIPSATLDTPNGLDTLAAAALANTSAEFGEMKRFVCSRSRLVCARGCEADVWQAGRGEAVRKGGEARGAKRRRESEGAEYNPLGCSFKLGHAISDHEVTVGVDSVHVRTNVTSTSAVTVIQGKAVAGTGMVAIPITAQMAPALLGGFKTDSSQRQSPTIRETPKRLAATRAEAEQAAAAHAGTNTAVKRNRLASDSVMDDVEISTAAAAAATTAANLLLSNGSLPKSSALKPDPECVGATYAFHGGSTEFSSNWNLPSSSAVASAVSGGSVILTENNRRRTRDEGWVKNYGSRDESFFSLLRTMATGLPWPGLFYASLLIGCSDAYTRACVRAQITDDEAARREKRRERNRVAAAKCRQNRQNQIEELKARRKLLEDEGNRTRQLIQNLLHEKAQMEELLKKHAQSGCPAAAQYFENGTLLLRLSAAAAAASSTSASTSASANTTSAQSIRIIQPSNPHQLQLPNPGAASIASTISSPAVIKPEAPSSSTPMTFVPAQRPNTLSLVTSTKVELPTPMLDSAAASSATTTHLAAHLWSPSVAAKIKTPGGENWVNSQIGLPPITVRPEKDVTTSATASTTTLLSTPDILHHLGISLAAAHASSSTVANKPNTIQIGCTEGKNTPTLTSPSASSTPSTGTASTTTATTNMG